MQHVRYSNRALADLREIGAFTLETWGLAQADSYLLTLFKTCELLAKFPRLGRRYGPSHESRRRFEIESHVILYSLHSSGVTVQRILHKRELLPPSE